MKEYELTNYCVEIWHAEKMTKKSEYYLQNSTITKPKQKFLKYVNFAIESQGCYEIRLIAIHGQLGGDYVFDNNKFDIKNRVIVQGGKVIWIGEIR